MMVPPSPTIHPFKTSTKKTEDKNALEVTFTVYADEDYEKNLTSLIGYATR